MQISIFIYAFLKLYLILNIYQQAHYQFKFYLKHFLFNFIFYDTFPMIVLMIGILNPIPVIQIICSIYLVLFAVFYCIARVKLKFTKRIWRLSGICLCYLGLGLIPYVGPFLLLFLEFSIFPVLGLERGISYGLNRPYLVRAKQKMTGYTGRVIAVTGSFGKTSTKVLLNQALNLFGSASATQKSYNTELGISKFINGIADVNVYDTLVLEFGASHRRDIAKLKKIARPQVGFVTGIGYMHVETFGSLETIIEEKMSLLSGCETAVLNFDCPYIREYPVPKDIHIISYGLEYGYYQAKHIEDGAFELYYKDTSLGVFKTCLVGRHQILNLTGVLAYLYEMGASMEILKKGVLSFQGEKNRLELKKMNHFTVLDDSFNSNYKGFIEALNILKNHKGKRILITPGMVELGRYKKELFAGLVEYMVSSSDIIILIGYYQTKELYRTLKEYNKEIYLVRNFMEGYRLFLWIAKQYQDSMLLIENDVPDLYRVGLI